MRGQISRIASIKKREKTQALLALERRPALLEVANQQRPCLTLIHNIRDTKLQINLLFTTQAERALQWTQSIYFKLANKPDKLLSARLRAKERINSVHSIRAENGSCPSNPDKIAHPFYDFYNNLYKYKSQKSPSAPQDFLKNIILPQVTDLQNECLGQHITVEEVEETIKLLKLGKAPGPDGLMALYYKKFKVSLSHPLTRFYNNILSGRTVPEELLRAHITVIPKPNKDHTSAKNYRPISLLNLDYKILTSILANRLNAFLLTLIHKDQAPLAPPLPLRPLKDPTFGPDFKQENNLTVVSEFFLLGFRSHQGLRISLLCLLSLIYCATICGNLLIITLVSTSKNLHTPMYFFISQLSISDILVVTDIVPNLLHILLNNGGTITFVDCITQLYFLCAPEAFECFLLTLMSYDRYVAICNPLRYSTIMTSTYCTKLSIICWLLGFSIVLIYVIKIATLVFCGSNIIDHLFCDIVPLVELACSDTFITHLVMSLLSIPLIFIPTTIIVMSYSYIVLAILRIPSSTGRHKAFSTCSSHLIVVSIFYWTFFSVYVVPTKGRTVTIGKILSLLYTVFTPLINPIIYSLRNEDIRKAIQMLYIKGFKLIG
ncbi:olfactory receptor 5P66-like [Eleutherodactylus coqui]|uniref:olfactory receptor 5P66-like n=1 Tax=Eleutherodactylus coqui TaxID=57060 RepID=UPI0034620095